MMKDITVQPDITIRQAMKKLNQTGGKCLVITDDVKNLLGTLSDGDLRKAILKGCAVGDSIKDIYHRNPTILVEGKYCLQDAKTMFTRNNPPIKTTITK